jgi:selenoprotein W-related protein
VKTEVSIEYCVVWNYTPKAVSLAAKILELGERIKSLSLIPSSGGAFEIRANGKLLHSKLDTGDWPDFDAIVKAIKKLKWAGAYSLFFSWACGIQKRRQAAALQSALCARKNSALGVISAIRDPQFAICNPQCSNTPLLKHSPESEGCLVALAVFKTVVAA